jgi:hypothetical protein
MDQEKEKRQDYSRPDVPVSIPELTHRHLEAVLQLLKRAKTPDAALIEQAEAQLRQVIVAIKPLSPDAAKQRLQTKRLTMKQLLDALRDGCDCLNVALDEFDEGNTQQCTQQVERCQSIVTEILTTW